MEPADTLPAMPSFENLRRGQAAACQRFKDGLLNTVVKLPTGYGKTRLAATAFAVLRAMDVVDIMIHIVPQVGQATQAGEEIPRDLAALGIATKSCDIGANKRLALRMCRSGEAVVFIATVQAIVMGKSTLEAIQEITGGKRCLLVIDEYHHYGIDAAWSRQIAKVPHVAFLAMSATPDRKGEQPVFGEPHVSVSYDEAVQEGAVKVLGLNAYNYRIDFVNREDGEVTSFTITELIAEAGGSPDEIEKWAAARQARWTPKYVSPLISTPVERLIGLFADHGFRGQMIVYALCCSHAQVVCEQVKYLVPDGMSVDWVGTGPSGRTDDENAAILHRFCPPKNANGTRPWSLHVLVCVGMAGEGLDIRDAVECVFLTSPAINNTAKQKIGRLSRVIPARQFPGVVNVDAASQWAPYVGERVMAVFDADEPPPVPGEAKEREAGEVDYQPIPDGPIVNVIDVSLVDIQSDPEFLYIKAEVKAEGIKRGLTDPEAEDIADRAALNYKKRNDERFSETFQQASARDRLDMRVRKVAGLAVRVVMRQGREFQRDMPGEYAKRINTAKKRVFGAVAARTAAELEQQNAWVRALEAKLLNGELPPWL